MRLTPILRAPPGGQLLDTAVETQGEIHHRDEQGSEVERKHRAGRQALEDRAAAGIRMIGVAEELVEARLEDLGEL